MEKSLLLNIFANLDKKEKKKKMKGKLKKGKPEEVQVIRRINLSVFPIKGKDDNKRFEVLKNGK